MRGHRILEKLSQNMKLDFSCDYGIVLRSKKIDKLGPPEGYMTNKIKLFMMEVWVRQTQLN
jgi:hypothetical protein